MLVLYVHEKDSFLIFFNSFSHADPFTLDLCDSKAFSNPQTIVLMCIRSLNGGVVALPGGIQVMPVALVLLLSSPN